MFLLKLHKRNFAIKKAVREKIASTGTLKYCAIRRAVSREGGYSPLFLYFVSVNVIEWGLCFWINNVIFAKMDFFLVLHKLLDGNRV